MYECHSFVNSLLHYLFVEYCTKLIFSSIVATLLMLLQPFQACMQKVVNCDVVLFILYPS